MKKKILISSAATIATIATASSAIISCGSNQSAEYTFEGKKFSNKKDLIEYARSRVVEVDSQSNGENLWKLMNAGANKYFTSPTEARNFIFKNKITTKKVFIPNKYKFGYKDKAHKFLNDDEIASFSSGEEGTYYAFRISGNKWILSEQLAKKDKKVGNQNYNELIFKKAKERAINSFLQIHQIYKYDNLYFPNKDTLREYLNKKPNFSGKSLETQKNTVLSIGGDGAHSRPFKFKVEKGKKVRDGEYNDAADFIKDHATTKVQVGSKWYSVDEISTGNDDILLKNILENVDYVKIGQTKQRYIGDIEKGVSGTFAGNYVISSNGQVSRMKKSSEWKGTNQTFDVKDLKNNTIIRTLDAASDIAFYVPGDKNKNILNAIALPSANIHVSEKEQMDFQNFRFILNRYKTEMSKKLGDALWEVNENMSQGKRYSSFKAISYLRTWTLDKVIRNGIQDPNLINLINKFFNKGIKLLDYKLKELVVPIMGYEDAMHVDLTKIIDFEQDKRLFIDPEIMVTNFYKGRFTPPNSTKEEFNPYLISFMKSLQVYFAVEGYKMEETNNIKKEVEKQKSLKENDSSHEITFVPSYSFNYHSSSSKSLKSLKKIINNDWDVSSNFRVDETIKENLKNHMEKYLERTAKSFIIPNKIIAKEIFDIENFSWNTKELIKNMNDVSSLPEKERLEIAKNDGELMMAIYSESNVDELFSKRLKNNGYAPMADIHTSLNKFGMYKRRDNISEFVADVEEVFDKHHHEIFEVLNKIRKNQAIVNAISNEINSNNNWLSKPNYDQTAVDVAKGIRSVQELIKTLGEAAHMVSKISKVTKFLKLASFTAGPWGMVASVIIDVALEIITGIIGEEKVDGYVFKYGDGASDRIIWTGGKHTEHNIFGIKWETGKIDTSDLKVIDVVELTKDYESGFFYKGDFYKNDIDVAKVWLKNLKENAKQNNLRKMKGLKLGFSFGDNKIIKDNLDSLAEEIINTSKEESFVNVGGVLHKDNATLRAQHVLKIMQEIQPIWVAQLPTLIDNKMNKPHYENAKYSMPISKAIKLYNKQNDKNLVSHNRYLMIDPNNERDASGKVKKMTLKEAQSRFVKMFDDQFIEHKQVSLQESMSDKSFDELSNGFIKKEIYEAKSNSGKVEVFLDINDAIDWLISVSNYSKIPAKGKKSIFIYKDREFLSLTEFIEFILKNQSKLKGDKYEAQQIYN
ncbi:hypothetical protein [Mycoplasma todarodis]|uniref:Lipoprotein n=1 Tax=Mycoplasma todarodis TaxID=1937191 RepID=A0A4V2NI89_9MOLU|nr:hypothetical protein [Mycoplasma todarodis]TCG11965.1 hypothetical protein C4B25_00475 [Mycoplasma todarodis]